MRMVRCPLQLRPPPPKNACQKSGRQQKEGSELEYAEAPYADESEPNEIEIIVPQVSPMRPKQQHGAEPGQSYGTADVDPR